MKQDRAQRRLAAIVCADVVGYSRLVGLDEEGTIARFRTLLNDYIQPCVVRHGGRLVKTTGDGLLVEFGSVVDAVRCATETQGAIAGIQENTAEDRRLQFRVGINVGDVVIENDDIFGDGVNLAARLQELAPTGGIMVSRAVREQVGDRLPVSFEDLGERTVKNIQRPVHVYRVQSSSEATVPPADAADAGQTKPSIAVLPLANMSGDPEQEFFADGMTEDIITELSRFKELFVIARNSTFVYKGKAVKIQDVARELGVHFVVEGSVRKVGNRVRVTVQLIDAETGQHAWAERYDRQLEDVFAIQDEITGAIVSTLPGRIEAARRERAKRKPTENMAAYEYLLAGKVLHHRSTREDNAEAQRLLDKALALDPKYAHAHAWKACVLGQVWSHNWKERATLEPEIFSEVNTALALDDSDADVHRILAAVHLTVGDFDRSWHHQERALALNPNYDLVVVQHGEILTWLGEPEEGIEWIRRAMRLNPFHPARYWSHLGRAYFTARRYAEAAEAYKRLATPDQAQNAFLAAATAGQGDLAGAKACAERVLAAQPNFTVADYLATLHYKNEGDGEHLREKLLQAGLPA